VTGRERIRVAMALGTPDRVPVMCQLAIGHYFLQSGLDPVEIWHSSEAFGEALIRLQRRYGFDGILVNLPGRDPTWRQMVACIETREDGHVVHWKNGWRTAVPRDDLPRVVSPEGTPRRPAFAGIDPDRLFYVEPFDIAGPRYPYGWGFDPEPQRSFPPYQLETLAFILAHAGEVSVHAEVFSPFSQLLELVDHADALIAIIDEPAKVRACLDRLADGAIELGRLQAAAGADAILISSAFAGAGFISPGHYAEFVLPAERKVVAGIKKTCSVPVYTHTCGAIGDRLDLMAATGTDGIDALDPPPLGTIDLAAARRQTAGRLFLKGNIDPVDTMLRGSPDDVAEAARACLRAVGGAGAAGGYILSTACSIAPATPPQNILALRPAHLESGARRD
jgi:hypothetical protein